MSTTRTTDGSIVVEIADRGVGMIDHELSDANQRLGGPSSVDVSASRRMGLFVVGRLGARHGIGVQLSSTGAVGSGGGLTASVTVPASLVPSSQPDEAGRPIGIPSAAGVPAQGSSAQGSSVFGVPPQRAGMNGNGRAGSLSALVAGTDGPANPTGVFDAPRNAGSDSPLFATPPPTNGSPPGLPTRRPGSSILPDRPPVPSERPDPAVAGQAAADRAAAQNAREVAGQARLDQEAAESAVQDRAVAHPVDSYDEQDPGTRNRAMNGTHPNGSHPNPGPGPVGRPPAPTAGSPGEPKGDPPAEADSAAPRPEPDPAESPDGVVPDPGSGALPQRDGTAATIVPPSPPTMPIPLVGRTPTAGAQPAAQPGAQPTTRPADTWELVQPRSDANLDRRPERSAPGPQPLVQGRPPAAMPSTSRTESAPFQRPDELFAPSVPVIAEPEASIPDRQGDDNGHRSGFDLGETTPIFAEIASAWFRSNRPVPVNWETDEARPEPEPVRPQPEVRGAPSSALFRPARPVAPSTSPAVEHARESAVSTSTDREFTTAADEGWRAANGIETDRADELTAAGLPKRRPRARLVPGSAGSAVLAPPVTAARSAETIRGRLASYQQGVRQARESRMRGDTGAATAGSGTEPATAGGNHDEESS